MLSSVTPRLSKRLPGRPFAHRAALVALLFGTALITCPTPTGASSDPHFGKDVDKGRRLSFAQSVMPPQTAGQEVSTRLLNQSAFERIDPGLAAAADVFTVKKVAFDTPEQATSCGQALVDDWVQLATLSLGGGPADQIIALLRALTGHETLKEIEIDRVHGGDALMAAAVALPLHSLTLTECGITLTNVPALIGHKGLMVLNLEGNKLAAAALPTLAAALAHPEGSLRHLSLLGTGLTGGDLLPTTGSQTLTTLAVPTADLLGAPTPGSLPSLTTLTLTSLTPAGVTRLLALGAAAPGLTSLTIQEDTPEKDTKETTDQTRRATLALGALASARSTDKTPLKITLGGTPITGAVLTTAPTVDLQDGLLPPALAPAALGLIATNTTLTSLILVTNGLTFAHLTPLMDALRSGRLGTLQTLSLAHNPLGPAAADLLPSLAKAPALTTLDMTAVGITDLPLFSPPPGLRTLTLRGNVWGDESKVLKVRKAILDIHPTLDIRLNGAQHVYDLKGRGLSTDQDLDKTIKEISALKDVTILDLSGNKWTEDQFLRLFREANMPESVREIITDRWQTQGRAMLIRYGDDTHRTDHELIDVLGIERIMFWPGTENFSDIYILNIIKDLPKTVEQIVSNPYVDERWSTSHYIDKRFQAYFTPVKALSISDDRSCEIIAGLFAVSQLSKHHAIEELTIDFDYLNDYKISFFLNTSLKDNRTLKKLFVEEKKYCCSREDSLGKLAPHNLVKLGQALSSSHVEYLSINRLYSYSSLIDFLNSLKNNKFLKKIELKCREQEFKRQQEIRKEFKSISKELFNKDLLLDIVFY